jgi:hypothetical protein
MFKLSIALTLFASLVAVNAQATLPDVTDVSLIHFFHLCSDFDYSHSHISAALLQLPAACATNCAGLIELGTLCSVSRRSDLYITPGHRQRESTGTDSLTLIEPISRRHRPRCLLLLRPPLSV